jgi:peptidoglycan/LPS O-acetylase OafA/YrhL
MAGSPSATRTADSHYPALDGVRGVAILLVVVFHFGGLGLSAAAPAKLFARGWMGVDLFFVLSGFLITGILLDTKGATNRFLSFYTRRFLRIFPVYYLTLLLWFVLLPRLTTIPASDTRPELAPWYWLYLSNWLGADSVRMLNHFWSLAIEEQFYLVWPTIVFLCRRRTLAAIAVAVLLGALVLRGYLVLGRSESFQIAYRGTFARADTLVVGALCALAVRTPRVTVFIVHSWRRLAAAIAGGWLVVASLSRGFALETHVVQTAGFSMTALLSGLIVVGCVLPNSQAVGQTAGSGSTLLKRMLSVRLLRRLGKVSYGMYVIHWPLFLLSGDLVKRIPRLLAFVATTPGLLAYVAAGVLGTFLCAVLSWHLFEKHFLGLKDHFRPAFS